MVFENNEIQELSILEKNPDIKDFIESDINIKRISEEFLKIPEKSKNMLDCTHSFDRCVIISKTIINKEKLKQNIA